VCRSAAIVAQISRMHFQPLVHLLQLQQVGFHTLWVLLDRATPLIQHAHLRWLHYTYVLTQSLFSVNAHMGSLLVVLHSAK